ncbi:MAG: DMT family transporter [Candidatus Kapaibacterium sp.]
MNPWMLLMMLAALWAPSFLFIKIGLHDIPPITLACARLGLAALLLYPALRVKGGRLPRDRETWRKMAIMGFFASALPFAMISLGETVVDSGIAAIFNGATPIATAALAHFFIAEEHLTPKRLVGVLVGFAGIVTIFLPGLLQGGNAGSVLGMIALAVAAASYGVSIVYARRNLRGLPPLVGPTMQLGLGALILLPAALGIEGSRLQVPGLPALGALLFLAIFGTALAYIVYYRLIETSSATFLSLVTYFLPPVGVLLGVAVLDEHASWSAAAGCGLVLAGVLIVNDVLGGVRRLRAGRAYASAPEE